MTRASKVDRIKLRTASDNFVFFDSESIANTTFVMFDPSVMFDPAEGSKDST